MKQRILGHTIRTAAPKKDTPYFEVPPKKRKNPEAKTPEADQPTSKKPKRGPKPQKQSPSGYQVDLSEDDFLQQPQSEVPETLEFEQESTPQEITLTFETLPEVMFDASSPEQLAKTVETTANGMLEWTNSAIDRIRQLPDTQIQRDPTGAKKSLSEMLTTLSSRVSLIRQTLDNPV